MKIAFFDTKSYDKDWFDLKAPEFGQKIIYYEERLSEETLNLAHGCQGVCVFVNDDVNKKVVEGLYKMGVEVILLRCAGFNNVDLEAAKNRITVMRVPGYSPQAVAEFAFGLLLAVNRNIHRAYIRTRNFNMSLQGLMGTDLHGKTAGIIGTGKIGQEMIKLCLGFGMKVLAYDPYQVEELKKWGVEYVELKELYKKSDVISLHCPQTEENRHLINEKSLSKMKNGVYIINTSRGALIDAAALIENLLIPGKIGGIALDVYEDEGGVFYEDKSNEVIHDEKLARLITFPNVLITSHQGYFTKEAMETICLETLGNALVFERGEELVNEVK